MSNSIIDKIKTKGYWRILFRPLTSEIKIGQLERCKQIVEQNGVKLRGWDYPHFPRRKDESSDLLPGDNYYVGYDDWMQFKELWRMYQSGQFIHYKALSEDWYEEGIKHEYAEYNNKYRILKITETIYFITEVFEFLSRLTKQGIYKDGVDLSIKLMHTEGRILYAEHGIGMRYLEHYKTAAPEISFERRYSEKQVAEDAPRLARDVLLHIFERFGWKPSADMIKEYQMRLLEKKH
ncbi:hypothetical protein IBX73_07675 [candidate division WOR-3 bacterium]|nr:hypothetical protein [candidate division WOR-3 bacterium]